MTSRALPRGAAGFTLTELMVAVAVVAIFAVFALPSLQILMMNNRIATQMNDVISVLAYARAEAMRRGARVAVCPSSNEQDCSGSDWSIGMIVFADTNRDGLATSGEEILRTLPGLAGGNTLQASGGISTVLQFRGTGVPMQTGALKLCDSRPDEGKQLEVLAAGSFKNTRGVSCP